MSPVLEASSMGSPWRLALVIPIAVLALLVIIVCVLLVFCCRTRTPKNMKKGAPETSTMPQSETKNTVVHGSQADSGVFTLESSKLKSSLPVHNYSSDETAVENWTSEHYDLSNDPYLNEVANPDLFQGVW
ncbi:hypothetical protein ANCCAN_07950 [Ancylostoma caninum]|uniref:Uncharacterized protein n=1 Tax=Ancylostoma caninum TaxID=29170 RepID=A0A368GNQ2_ANCCA|nr:hypothetical protein ANCCAN_07950 [Ancylostoma caninum]